MPNPLRRHRTGGRLTGSRWRNAARVCGLPGILAALACDQEPGKREPSVRPSATTPASTAAAATPPKVVPPVATPGLVVEAAEGESAVVSLDLSPLDVRIPIAKIRDPWACLGRAMGPGHWGVRCTPDFRCISAEVQQLGDTVRIRHSDRELKELRLNKSVRLDTRPDLLVSARAAPEAACKPSQRKQRSVRVSLAAGHDINARNDTLHLTAGTRVLQIVSYWAYRKCTPKTEGEAMVVECPPGPKQTHGRFWLVSLPYGQSAVRFTWRDSEERFGAMVLPCHRKGQLVLPSGFEGGIYNYGMTRPLRRSRGPM